MTRRTVFRTAWQAGLLGCLVVVGAMAISEPAWPQGSEHAKAEPNLTVPQATLVQRRPAQSPCAPTSIVRAGLLEMYGETPRSLGIGPDGKQVMELYSTLDGSTWTAVTTDTNGISCIVATGKYWMDISQKPTGPGA